MPCDCGHLHGIQSFFKKPTGGFVPEIVESEIEQKGRIRLDSLFLALFFIGGPGPADSAAEGCCNAVFFRYLPDTSADSLGKSF